MTIKEKIKSFKEEFNIHFEREIRKALQEQRDFHPVITDLDEPLTNIVLDYTMGGKRIRPFLIYFFSEKNTDNESLQKICMASELFHLAALIHDDIIDNSPTRRGAKTIHTATQEFAKENTHLGKDIAILMGDVFLTEAITTAAQLPRPIFEKFREMIQRTIHGQYLDSFGMNQLLGETPESEVLARHELKTAWYTFASPATLGFMMHEHYSEEKELVLQNIMKQIGLLFQIRDDIIDCIDENSGKPLFGDIFEGQTTWVTLHIKEYYPQLLDRIIDAKDTNNTDELKNIFKEIDLVTAYKQEFKKCEQLISGIQNQYSDIKEKAYEVLELLTLS